MCYSNAVPIANAETYTRPSSKVIVKRRFEWEAVLAFQYFLKLFLRYFAKAWA